MKDIQVIVPYGAASGPALFFRVLQKYANNKGINLIPIFRPGAEGMIALNDAATNSYNPNSTAVVTLISDVLSVHPAKRFSQDDFIPIANLAQSKVYIVAGNHVAIDNLSELLDSMKNQPEKLSWAIASYQFHEDLKNIAKKLRTDPDHMVISKFNGSPSLPNLIGGFIDVGIYPSSLVEPYIESKQVKLLGTYRKTDAQGLGVDYVENHMKVLRRDGFSLFLLKGASVDTVKFWEQFCKDFLNDPATPQALKEKYFRMPENGNIKEIYQEFKQNEISLTSREEEIAGLIKFRGLSNRQISKQLGIGESAVKVHVTSILKKYHIQSRTQLAAFG